MLLGVQTPDLRAPLVGGWGFGRISCRASAVSSAFEAYVDITDRVRDGVAAKEAAAAGDSGGEVAEAAPMFFRAMMWGGSVIHRCRFMCVCAESDHASAGDDAIAIRW